MCHGYPYRCDRCKSKKSGRHHHHHRKGKCRCDRCRRSAEVVVLACGCRGTCTCGALLGFGVADGFRCGCGRERCDGFGAACGIGGYYGATAVGVLPCGCYGRCRCGRSALTRLLPCGRCVGQCRCRIGRVVSVTQNFITPPTAVYAPAALPIAAPFVGAGYGYGVPGISAPFLGAGFGTLPLGVVRPRIFY